MTANTDTPDFEARTRELRRRLARPLPGRPAMEPLTTSNRPFVPIERARACGCREAGALALLYPRGGDAHVVLTLRPATMADHAGQVSLPGGRLEDGEDALAAALRETTEELGVAASALDVLGALTPLFVPPTGFCISPFVAAARRRPDFAPEAGEVEAVIEVALADLDDAHRQVEQWDIRGESRRVPFFAVGGYKVWGATAMILAELSAIWSEAVTATADAGDRLHARGDGPHA